MPCQHIRSGLSSTLQHCPQVGSDPRPVLRAGRRITPSTSCTVVDADPRVPGDKGCNQCEVGGHLTCAWFDHDGRTAGAAALQVQAVSVDVDHPTVRRVGLAAPR